jgi:ArpU family phage transcriptional regulator
MIDYYKEAEKVLTELPALKKSIGNLQERKVMLAKYAAEPPTQDKKKQRGAFSKAESLWIEYRQTLDDIDYTQKLISHIERILEQLDSEERVILIFWYIDHLPKEQILEELHYESITTLYNIKNRAVRCFAMLYYGGRLFR